jgi:hypothetical protein
VRRIREINPSTLVLTLTTLALACTTLYFARALKQEQLRSIQAATATAPKPDTTGTLPRATVLKDPPRDSGPATDTTRDPGDIAVARYRLSRLDDLQGRDELARTITAGARNDWMEVGAAVGLTAEEVARIVDLATMTGLQNHRRRNECITDPACNVSTLEATLEALPDSGTLSIVGEAKYARIKAYEDSLDERVTVLSLRWLPAGRALTDAQAGELALAMATERQRFSRSAEEAGRKVEQFSGGTPVLYALHSTAPDGVSVSIEDQLASAMAYNERIHRRAAGILPAETLVRFKAAQDATLDAYRQNLTEKQIRQAARRRVAEPWSAQDP